MGRFVEAWTAVSSSGVLSSRRFRSFFLYIKEPLQDVVFGSMIQRSWLALLTASPLVVVMLPMISLAMIGLALVDIYQLILSKEKNLDLWLNAIVGSLCACGMSASLALFEIGILTGTSFFVAPPLLLTSVALLNATGFFQLGLSIVRALRYPSGTQQRLDQYQSAVHWGIVSATMLAMIGSLVFVILLPELCIPAGIAFAATTTALTTMSILWRMMPSRPKSWIKQCLRLELHNTVSNKETNVVNPNNPNNPNPPSQPIKKASMSFPKDCKLGWQWLSRVSAQGQHQPEPQSYPSPPN